MNVYFIIFFIYIYIDTNKKEIVISKSEGDCTLFSRNRKYFPREFRNKEKLINSFDANFIKNFVR